MCKKDVRLLILSFVLIVFLLSPCMVHAADHLSFKNVPITGTLEAFCDILLKNGFERNTRSSLALKDAATTASLKGQFSNEACELVAIATKQSKTVFKVSLFMPLTDDWLTLNYNYFLLKRAFVEKFSEGESLEYFRKPYIDGDLNEMLALKRKKCTYRTCWTMSTGSVLLEIQHDGRIAVTFEDALNVALKKSEE